MPAISVIVPVYQGEALLPGCVESVRRQTFDDWELLLIDDGSTDNSRTLCEHYAAGDARIRVLAQPRNLGVSAARNRGLQEARGDYVAFLDADDRYVPGTLS
ncbi:MAG: glycosyltransferase family 2 protein, partial [Oscillibacter sp.]|nr:glycosyltransferase family 2 protein [Oscillibacter sp.]